jgi:sugar lactone lactonase YvrE
VEVFKYSPELFQLKYESTISHSLLRTPNDVVFWREGVFVTNDHRYLTGIGRIVEEYLVKPWGNVVYCNLDGGQCQLAIDEVAYPNGIALNANNQLLVASSTGTSVLVYNLPQNYKKSIHPKLSTNVPLDFA